MFCLFLTQLPVACNPTQNICLQSCQPTEESRNRELLHLLYGYFMPDNCNGTNPIPIEYPLPGFEVRRKMFINYNIYMATVCFLSFCLFFCLLAVLSPGLSLALKFKNKSPLLRW